MIWIRTTVKFGIFIISTILIIFIVWKIITIIIYWSVRSIRTTICTIRVIKIVVLILYAISFKKFGSIGNHIRWKSVMEQKWLPNFDLLKNCTTWMWLLSDSLNWYFFTPEKYCISYLLVVFSLWSKLGH